MDDALVELSEQELLVFAGLARVLIRLDGQFSAAEAECLEELAGQLAAPGLGEPARRDPYRGSPSRQPLGADGLYDALDEAARTYPDDAAVRASVRAVERPEARLYVHAMLHALARADLATRSELSMLDWLAEEWNL